MRSGQEIQSRYHERCYVILSRIESMMRTLLAASSARVRRARKLAAQKRSTKAGQRCRLRHSYEAYVRLADFDGWGNGTAVFGRAAEAMWRILVEMPAAERGETWRRSLPANWCFEIVALENPRNCCPRQALSGSRRTRFAGCRAGEATLFRWSDGKPRKSWEYLLVKPISSGPARALRAGQIAKIRCRGLESEISVSYERVRFVALFFRGRGYHARCLVMRTRHIHQLETHFPSGQRSSTWLVRRTRNCVNGWSCVRRYERQESHSDISGWNVDSHWLWHLCHRRQPDHGDPARSSDRIAAADRRRGHGRVFMAEQTQPIQRIVAFKIIAGNGHAAGHRPFRGRAAGRGNDDHPNIAKVRMPARPTAAALLRHELSGADHAVL